jgi:hypothetical protein
MKLIDPFIKISLALPIVSNFLSVSYEGNVKHHLPFKYSYQATLYADKVLLVWRLNWPKIIGKNEVLSKSEGFKL